ncbi:MAG: precorrin-8X methylmutase [Cyanobacteria bacterium J06621_3]
MPAYREHDITLASFAQIDREAKKYASGHDFSEAEYAIARRIVHTTADFDFLQLLQFHGDPVAAAGRALKKGSSIVTDVSMVAAGIGTVVRRTWDLPVVVALQQAPARLLPGQTRSALGMRRCSRDHPDAVVVVGNAPTALLAVCEDIAANRIRPAVVIGAPVGFINVVESKQALAALSVPHILVSGRKGGSAVAAAILNALMIWTWEQS